MLYNNKDNAFKYFLKKHLKIRENCINDTIHKTTKR